MIEPIKLSGRVFASVAFCTNFSNILKKTENVEQTKLQNIKNLIPFIPIEDGEKDRIMTLLGNGEKKAEQDIPLIEFPFNVNKHLVSIDRNLR
jgi:hypothetical protein